MQVLVNSVRSLLATDRPAETCHHDAEKDQPTMWWLTAAVSNPPAVTG
jgi:hypothetical protein